MTLKVTFKQILFIPLIISSIASAQNLKQIEEVTELTYGQYPVGFQFLKNYDLSRNAIAEQADKRGRIVPIYVWYPAVSSGLENAPMSIKEYINYWGLETNYTVKEDSLYWSARKNFGKSFLWLKDMSMFDEINKVGMQTRAVQGLKEQGGNFPLVILNHGPIINWLFVAEFLASYGYVVAYSPVAGTFDKRLEENISGVATQLNDMEFSFGELVEWPQINSKMWVSLALVWGHWLL